MLRKNCDGRRMYPTQVDELSGVVDRFSHRAQEGFAVGQYSPKQSFHFSNQRTAHCFRLPPERSLNPVQSQIEATLSESAPEHVSKPSRRWFMGMKFPYQRQLHEPLCWLQFSIVQIGGNFLGKLLRLHTCFSFRPNTVLA
jgi:hypothetical protein